MIDINIELLVSFRKIIEETSGLVLKHRDEKRLIESISNRMKLLDLQDVTAYYQMILPLRNKENKELIDLISLIVNNESFFFRDKGQFHLLEKHILPQLIHKHRHDMTLKIWCAGCSRGEEPYSIAILLSEMLKDHTHWKLNIVGTDIDPIAIEKANLGIYNEFAFRSTNENLKNKYFTQDNKSWKIHAQIKKMVNFFHSNLVKENYPNLLLGLYDIDLILCRNVFIYFNEKSINHVLKKFNHTLINGGYLMTGHGELSGKETMGFNNLLLEGSIIYQKNLVHNLS